LYVSANITDIQIIPGSDQAFQENKFVVVFFAPVTQAGFLLEQVKSQGRVFTRKNVAVQAQYGNDTFGDPPARDDRQEIYVSGNIHARAGVCEQGVGDQVPEDLKRQGRCFVTAFQDFHAAVYVVQFHIVLP